jgi:hypothetical protein
VAKEEFFFSNAKIQANTPNTKNQPLHWQLEEIHKSFYQAQEPNALFDIPFCLGNVSKQVNLYVPLQFIIGDVEGGDHLCSRQTYRGKACLRLFWTCGVSTANAAQTDLTCSRIHVADIQHIVATSTKEELNKVCQGPGFNSLYTKLTAVRIHTVSLVWCTLKDYMP